MDTNCENMDKNAGLLERTIDFLAARESLPIPYAGPGGGRFRNPPAPHLEFCVITSGRIDTFRVGPLTQHLPPHHLAVHNVHFGNRSRHYPDVISACLFIDIGSDPAGAALGAQPFSIVRPVRNSTRLADLIHRINERCLALYPPGGAYPDGPPAFDPRRDVGGRREALLLLRAARLEFWGALLDEIRAGETAGTETASPAVHLAESFLQRHYARPELALPDIARAAHLSPDHFGRLFHRETGQTPMRRLRSIRLQHAGRLLRQDGLRIREIARHVGFEDPLHFSRAFRAEMGCSPRAYRLRLYGRLSIQGKTNY